MINRLRPFFATLRASRRGNVLMIFAFAMIPMVFATGMGVDYTRAARLQTKLNAIADAAALAAVTQPMMLNTDDEAKAAAKAMFVAQASALGTDLIFDGDDTKQLDIKITPIYSASSPGREAVVTWHALSKDAFSGILGKPTIPIGGTSTATADKAPYINFYLLLDTSPSMLLPTTTDGLNRMRQQTATSHLPNGCAFACHTMNPHTDNVYVRDNNGKEIWLDPNNGLKAYAVDSVTNGYIYSKTYTQNSTKIAKESSGYYADSYWLASHNASFPTLQKPNIEMRIDAEQEAVQALVPTAKEIADENKVMYQMAVYRFDYYGPDNGSNYAPIAGLTPLDSDANVDSVVQKSTGLPLTYWWSNSNITSSKNIDDQSTDFHTAFDQMNKLMPNPGTGQTKDDPQEVMFIITDGMSDENLGGRTHKELQPTHIDQCNAIKARNIRIAILYTQYLPESLTGDDWSISNVLPVLSPTDKVAQQLQACASPGLYQMVSTDDSIPDALNALFRQAVATAHLTQ